MPYARYVLLAMRENARYALREFIRVAVDYVDFHACRAAIDWRRHSPL